MTMIRTCTESISCLMAIMSRFTSQTSVWQDSTLKIKTQIWIKIEYNCHHRLGFQIFLSERPFWSKEPTFWWAHAADHVFLGNKFFVSFFCCKKSMEITRKSDVSVNVLHPVHLLQLPRQVAVHDLHLLLQPANTIASGAWQQHLILILMRNVLFRRNDFCCTTHPTNGSLGGLWTSSSSPQ